MNYKKTIIILVLALLLPMGLASCTNDAANENKESKNSSEEKQASEENKESQNNSDEKQASEENNKENEEAKNNKEDSNNEGKENEEETGPFEGDIPIGFELKSYTDDKTYKLSDYLGKDAVVINFFGVHCPPCRMEMPELNKVYKEYKDKGLQVLAVHVGNPGEDEEVKRLISENNLEFPVIYDETNEIVFNYGIRQIPVNVFIGKDGIINKSLIGMQTKESYEAEVKAILEKEPSKSETENEAESDAKNEEDNSKETDVESNENTEDNKED